jgi:diaminopimelate epimerase
MKFTKMHGAGNDYLYVNCFAESIPTDPGALARAMADRNTGVGADGLILMCPAEGADAEMRMFNADGSYAEMCGNGIRCVAKYLYDHAVARRDPLRITSAGKQYVLELDFRDGKVSRVRVDMGEPEFVPAKIGTTLQGNPPTDVPLEVGGQTLRVTTMAIGNPHCVAFVDALSDDLVLRVGPLVERHSSFPNRVNVEFVTVLNRETARQRTWERGSGETLACGSGACAVAVAGALTNRLERNVTVKLLGGDLQIQWNESDNHVYMTGPAAEVFSGDWPNAD